MELTESLLPAYLSTRGLLHGRRVAGVTVSVRRSVCATVRFDDGSHWFIKQARYAPSGERHAAVTNEAAVLSWAHHASDSGELRRLMPALHFHDPQEHVLVTEHLAAYRPLMEHYQRRRAFSRAVAFTLAAHLAHCHAILPASAAPGTERSIRPLEPPFPAWDRVTPEQIAAQPEAYIEFVETVQNTDGLIASLQALRAAWRPTCLIHADAKSDNIMYRPRSAAAGAQLRLIDWELAGWGDPAWDTGTVIGDYLHHWLGSLSPNADGTLVDWLAGARIPFTRVQRAIATFWDAYRRRAAPDADPTLAARTAGYAGVYLLTRALAESVTAGQVGPTGLCTLQVAKQLIRQPESAAGRLLC